MSNYEPSPRTRPRRRPQRVSYDRELVHAILDEALICHVGILGAEGEPVVIPMVHARMGERLIFHGAARARILACMALPICVTVTLVDGLVFGRSMMRHSMNYRSVVVYGQAEEVTDPDEKLRCLDAIVDHVLAGRSREARRPTASELAATRVMALPLHEVSAKVRSGPPADDPDDLQLPVWAGEIPLGLQFGAPVPAADLAAGAAAPLPARLLRRSEVAL